LRSETDGNMEIKDAYMDVISEIAIMKKINHICLIRLHEVIDEKEGDKLYMSKITILNKLFVVMDYAKYG
jgi:hypothetical protein